MSLLQDDAPANAKRKKKKSKANSKQKHKVQPVCDISEGTRDELGRLAFDDHADFQPNLTPRQIIQAGSFGG